MIACFLRPKVAGFDPYVQQPRGENQGSESLNPDKDPQAEIGLVEQIESLACDLS
jgi:hypothetical protein